VNGLSAVSSSPCLETYDVRSLSYTPILLSLIKIHLGYPPDHINAVLTNALHFVGLLTFYLGIKLPFIVEWVGPGASLGDGNSKLGVGAPWVGAVRGAESGNWAR
jgi:hypothetical protein